MKNLSVEIIGSGNVATFLCRSFVKSGVRIGRLISRNAVSGEALAAEAGTVWSNTFTQPENEETIIISTVKDSAAEEVWQKCSFGKTLVLHTAGALPLKLLETYAENCGVLYPLQTISARETVDSSKVPFLIEANTPENLAKVRALGETLSPKVTECSSAAREKLHLAAVFANNFANLCFRMAWEIAGKEGIDPEILLPLIEESCAKLHTLTPAQAQTGPAVRGDENIMKKHLALLEEMPEAAAFYKAASAEIYRRTLEGKG